MVGWLLPQKGVAGDIYSEGEGDGGGGGEAAASSAKKRRRYVAMCLGFNHACLKLFLFMQHRVHFGGHTL